MWRGTLAAAREQGPAVAGGKSSKYFMLTLYSEHSTGNENIIEQQLNVSGRGRGERESCHHQ